VLLYHRIADPDGEGFAGYRSLVSATPRAFARQMEYVAERFTAIGLAELVAFLEGEAPLPPRPLLVTFDDGYADNHEHGLPVLHRLGLPAVEFLITGAIGTGLVPWWDECAALLGSGPRCEALVEELKRLSSTARADRLQALRRRAGTEAAPAGPPFMDWDQIAELEASGVSCQPHTHSHPILSLVEPGLARCEIAASKRIVDDRLGRASVAFAYPNGGRDDYGCEAVEAVADLGFRVAFTTARGPVRPAGARARRLELPRVPIQLDDDFETFRLKLHGLLPLVWRVRSALGERRPTATTPP
jgi:peptidoglycan/xylan/chitin deacetylase (PgdA/CDA1 family)